MCDDPTLTNRGNSYFVWFRADDDKIQIYKTIADVFYLEADIPFTINDDVWYDIKTIYDKTTGLIEVWVNNEYAASWLDTSPYLTGNSISVRSGNSDYKIENLKVYHIRTSSAIVTIGGAAYEVRYQNPNPLTPSCKVKSIAVDSSANVSVIASDFGNIDWTNPDPITYLNDGTGADISTTGTSTELSANWAASFDVNSDIARYWYAIGTSAGATDVVSWTDNWFDTTVTHTGLDLISGTTYYFSVFAENGAGLYSDTISSDGQTLVAPTDPPVAYFHVFGTNVCESDSIHFENASTDATTYLWSIPGAVPSTSTTVNPYFHFPVSGTYEVTLQAMGPGGTDVYVQSISVVSYGQPVAAFTQSDMVTTIDDPFITFVNTSTDADGYYWSFGDGATSTDFEPWHEYTGIGIFDIMLIAINGTCPNDTAWSAIEITAPLDVTEIDQKDFIIWPNPASTNLSFNFGNEWKDQKVYLRILDISGRLINETILSTINGSAQIPLQSQWSEGLYVARITTGKQTIEHKFVLQR